MTWMIGTGRRRLPQEIRLLLGIVVAWMLMVSLTQRRSPWAVLQDLSSMDRSGLPAYLMASTLLLIAALWLLAGQSLLMGILAWGGAGTSVARTLVREVVRSRGLLLPVALLLGVLAVLPALLDTAAPLRYRIQSYLSYAYTLTALLLSLLTILIACQSTAGDLHQRSSGPLFAKPLRRGAYIAGKWLGIIALDALVLAACGAVTYLASTRWLATGEAMDEYDRRAVAEQVLTARRAVLPQEPPDIESQVQQRYRDLLAANPAWLAQRGGDTVVLEEIRQQVRLARRSIAPLARQTFVFEGLAEVTRRQEAFQLRYKIDAAPRSAGHTVDLGLILNGTPLPLHAGTRGAQVLTLPAPLVDKEGRLEVVVVNIDPFNQELIPAGAVTFSGKEGFQVLYRVDTFGANFWRGMTLLWIRLAFLAILGIAATTFLSFPVACTFCLSACVVLAGAGQVVDGVQLAPLASILSHPSSFTLPDIPGRLADGRLISGDELLAHLLRIGGIWTLGCGVLGWCILRRREIARVQA